MRELIPLARRRTAILTIESALARIEASHPGRPLVVVSALAAGADRLLAEAVLRRPGARLRVVLPLPKFDFLDDFAMPALKEEFLRFLARTDEVAELPARASRDQAYAAASDRVLDEVDVLVAVRDGQAAQGRAETAEVVARGHARRLPLAWVHGGNRKSGTVEATSPGADQRRVTHENLLR